MKPRGTVQLLTYVRRETRELAKQQAAGRGEPLSKWVERAILDRVGIERANAGRLFANVNKEGKATT